MGGSLRVLLIEEHGIVRAGVRLLLQQTDDIVVVGEARDGASGLSAVARLAGEGGLDLVLTELALPDIDGLEVARRVKATHPGIRVLFLSMLRDDAHIAGMLDEVADGYLLKDAAGRELAPAIRVVMSGETYLSPLVAQRLVRLARLGREREGHADRLSGREREVLGLLAGGDTTKEAARRLGLTAKTVENHRAGLLAKLGAANTAAAIGLAYRAGLLRVGHDPAA